MCRYELDFLPGEMRSHSPDAGDSCPRGRIIQLTLYALLVFSKLFHGRFVEIRDRSASYRSIPEMYGEIRRAVEGFVYLGDDRANGRRFIFSVGHQEVDKSVVFFQCSPLHLSLVLHVCAWRKPKLLCFCLLFHSRGQEPFCFAKMMARAGSKALVKGNAFGESAGDRREERGRKALLTLAQEMAAERDWPQATR